MPIVYCISYNEIKDVQVICRVSPLLLIDDLIKRIFDVAHYITKESIILSLPLVQALQNIDVHFRGFWHCIQEINS